MAGDKAENQGDYPAAEQHYDSAAKHADARSASCSVIALERLGHVRLEQEKVEAAKEAFSHATDVADKAGLQSLTLAARKHAASALKQLADAKLVLKDESGAGAMYEQALSRIEEILKIDEQASSDQLVRLDEIECLFNLGVIAEQANNFPQAKEYFTRADDASTKLYIESPVVAEIQKKLTRDGVKVAKSGSIGATGATSDSADGAASGLEQPDAQRLSAWLALLNEADRQCELGAYERAGQMYVQALSDARRLKQPGKHKFIAMRELLRYSVRSKNFEPALPHAEVFHEQLKLGTYDSESKYDEDLSLLAKFYRRAKKYDEALAILREQLQYRSENKGKSPKYRGSVHENIGKVYLDKGDYDRAEKELNEAMTLCAGDVDATLQIGRELAVVKAKKAKPSK